MTEAIATDRGWLVERVDGRLALILVELVSKTPAGRRKVYRAVNGNPELEWTYKSHGPEPAGEPDREPRDAVRRYQRSRLVWAFFSPPGEDDQRIADIIEAESLLIDD